MAAHQPTVTPGKGYASERELTGYEIIRDPISPQQSYLVIG